MISRGYNLLAAAILFFAFGATAQTTKGLSDAEVQGQQLAQEILSQRPAENTNIKGVMQIRDEKGHRSEVPIVSRIIVTIDVANTNITLPDWYTFYQATLTNKMECLRVAHTSGLTNIYTYSTNANDAVPMVGDFPVIGRIFGSHPISAPALMTPFAGSDFWIADLGLEFFHWPDQKIIKHESRRSRACVVLESTNPNPTPGGYSRVDTWIDNETLGIVHAEAYDANGKLIKVFDPKSFKKVNGQWELQDMEIRNVQTGSRSWIKFDLGSGS
jgi:Outer membrane lipoprotein-sorting protein